MERLRPYLPHLLIAVLFAVLALAYCSPILEGKQIYQGDIANFKGSAQEIIDFREKYGEDPYWTNRMFGGMPAYQISAQYKYDLARYVDKGLRMLPRPADYIFLAFASFYLLMLSMGMNWRKALLGAAMYGMSSYLFIILEAGHNAKAHALAYFPLLVAALLMAFRRKYLLGAAVMTIAMALELYANHIQMTYYLGLLFGVFGVVYGVDAFKKKELKHYFTAIAALAFGVLLAVGMNSSRLLATYSYAQESIRGKSELTIDKEASAKTDGLDRDYVTQWSYGKTETLNLMIPNLYGGASRPFGEDSRVRKAIVQDIQGGRIPQQYFQVLASSASEYWGQQPFTSGPAYVGAVVCFLFVLGLFLVRGPMKWWLALGTLLSFMLAWGKNMMWFTDFMLDYFPMYNKFRAVSSALVIAELTIPILAILAVKAWWEDKQTAEEKKKALYWSLGLTAGLCAVLAMFSGSFFDFRGPRDGIFDQVPHLLTALKADRQDLLEADAWRSFTYILISGALLWAALLKKEWSKYILAGLTVLVLADLWQVDKRYLNDENFVAARQVEQPFRPTAADQQILKDKAYYRVWNQTVGTMQDASTSYFHYSIGGYHGAKLKRYQELWDMHLSKNNMQVVNMLNTRYIIAQGEQGPVAQKNPDAFGPVWWAEDLQLVDNADQEILALGRADLSKTAVIDRRFADQVANFKAPSQSDATIHLSKYDTNVLEYEVNTSEDRLAVFSEIYYEKGWNCYIDGKKQDYLRSNYVLRATMIPAGSKKVVFKFEPAEISLGNFLAPISALALFIMLGSIIWFRKKRAGIESDKEE